MSINEWSAHGQSDSNLGHKGQAVADTRTKSDSNLGRTGQAVADTRINRLIRWLTGSVSHLFYYKKKKKLDPWNVLQLIPTWSKPVLFSDFLA